MTDETVLADPSDISPISIVDEMKASYLDYAMSVIVARAVPDVRDGLKPVHRRILFSAQESGFVYNRPYRKSARLVGEVMGKYHPHGDSSIYDALARMTQDWSMRVPLIDGQGNFGSMDPDPPAAMRYTEARLAKVATALLDDLDKELESRGLRFARYADDFQIYVKTHRSARRVFASIERFLTRKLKLVINQQKSRIAKADGVEFLGFVFRGRRATIKRIFPRPIYRSACAISGCGFSAAIYIHE